MLGLILPEGNAWQQPACGLSTSHRTYDPNRLRPHTTASGSGPSGSSWTGPARSRKNPHHRPPPPGDVVADRAVRAASDVPEQASGYPFLLAADLAAPLRFVFAFCFRFSRLRSLSRAACSAASVIGSATTRCNGAILSGGAAFLDMAHSSCESTVNGCSPFRVSPPSRTEK